MVRSRELRLIYFLLINKKPRRSGVVFWLYCSCFRQGSKPRLLAFHADMDIYQHGFAIGI